MGRCADTRKDAGATLGCIVDAMAQEAKATAFCLSLIASCQLHGIDSETYLTEIMRVLPHWPRERYLELAPKH